MKTLTKVTMLISLTVLGISSCEDHTEEFDTIQNQQIEDTKMNNIEDELETSEHELAYMG